MRFDALISDFDKANKAAIGRRKPRKSNFGQYGQMKRRDGKSQRRKLEEKVREEKGRKKKSKEEKSRREKVREEKE